MQVCKHASTQPLRVSRTAIGVEFGVNAEGNGYETVEAETMDLIYHTGYKQIYLQIVRRSILSKIF